ncbi:pyruvate, phosphate dikinase [Paenibacillus sp. J2TS4]|uniref:pyruvate, phosphate dikinase n=1 Tax=Paenibacillus sp. J2TS4 TaxID=2807194 RepID=UPI001B159A1E|nr:pyruvate, phosphate dikinase [Paenibacillus sp. J2TS4]GIP32491.1 pyruvate, phosphate dikinase [Paenibacillus sp. J2TS4]
MNAVKWVFLFQEGSVSMKELLGGKGANLAEMTGIGLPVPPGFTVTTEACRAFYASGRALPEGVMEQVSTAMHGIEDAKGQRFGDPHNPLLVSVRSGSVSSMPGMMDTILNLGLNDETVQGLAKETNNPRFAYDCYRRLIQMYGNVVLHIPLISFEDLLIRMKEERGYSEESEVTAEDWQSLVDQYKQLIEQEAAVPFPQNVNEQLEKAIEAVFLSWNNARAIIYRKAHRIPDEQGTAVNIQAMVFGNRGDDCGTGVVFTRNPSTGDKILFGEFLTNAQGEDVVAGIRTPLPIARMEQEMPPLYVQLAELADKLERHYKDMQDIEFTVDKHKLYILQTRGGKRTPQAAMRIAVQLVEEGIITKAEALLRIEETHLDQLLHRAIDCSGEPEVLAVGLPASPGAASGQAVFDTDTAEHWTKEGKPVILVRSETTPEDIHGVLAAEGVLTSRGGMTSHAAVVARGMGKPCVCGCESLDIDGNLFRAGDRTIREGDWISIDGANGRVIAGKVGLKEAELSAELEQMLQWADEVRTLRVMTNADNPEDARKASLFGAEGIGLCRTEHMFFGADRLPLVRHMILAESKEERLKWLAELLPIQHKDFAGLFRAMDGKPVTIRLLDPPMHEFLPNVDELSQRYYRLAAQERREAAVPEGHEFTSDRSASTKAAGLATAGLDSQDFPSAAVEKAEVEQLLRKVRLLHEANPMLGQRGCRLGIVFPEIYEMQAEAIFRAAAECAAEGIRALPEIMIPLVGHVNELELMRSLVDRIAKRVLGREAARCPYKVGTMIEVPRAALTAHQIAEKADFFSFGTNDMTQMTFGYSRDDAEGKFLTHYVEQKVIPHNPFQVLDREGVGQLIEWAVQKGRTVKPHLKTGVCGEHGGDRQSIFFCHAAGLDYISCSPYRVPLARIAAAQAQLLSGAGSQDQK